MHKSQVGAFYHPELDVLRFVAFFAVFLSHGLPASSTYTLAGATIRAFSLGLPLFFCLSAFLITKLLLLERARTGSVDLRKFYTRRLLRIWPLYLSMLAISAGISALHRTLHITWPWYVAAFLMFGNAFWWIQTTVTHLWSISVEEQFYLFWPAVVRKVSKRMLLLTVLGTIAASQLMLVRFGLLSAPQDTRIWANTIVQGQFFAVGILFALGEGEVRVNKHLTRLILFVAALATCFISVYKLHAFSNPGELAVGPLQLCFGYALAAFGCLLLLISLYRTSHWPASFVYLGKVSYGLYVFHGISLTTGQYLFLRFGRLTSLSASFAMDVALAACSYRLIETPFLRLKQRYEVVQSRPVNT